jgi:hypothetical protein
MLIRWKSKSMKFLSPVVMYCDCSTSNNYYIHKTICYSAFQAFSWLHVPINTAKDEYVRVVRPVA